MIHLPRDPMRNELLSNHPFDISTIVAMFPNKCDNIGMYVCMLGVNGITYIEKAFNLPMDSKSSHGFHIQIQHTGHKPHGECMSWFLVSEGNSRMSYLIGWWRCFTGV